MTRKRDAWLADVDDLIIETARERDWLDGLDALLLSEPTPLNQQETT